MVQKAAEYLVKGSVLDSSLGAVAAGQSSRPGIAREIERSKAFLPQSLGSSVPPAGLSWLPVPLGPRLSPSRRAASHKLREGGRRSVRHRHRGGSPAGAWCSRTECVNWFTRPQHRGNAAREGSRGDTGESWAAYWLRPAGQEVLLCHLPPCGCGCVACVVHSELALGGPREGLVSAL